MLKKSRWSLLLVLLSVFILVACTNNDDPATYEESSVYEYKENLVAVGPNGLPLIHLTEEARDIVLEDFDYLAEILLENVPSQVVLERRFDISLEDVLAFMRNSIYDMEPIESLHFIVMDEEEPRGEMPSETDEIAANYLSSLLLWLSFDLEGLGHLGPRTLGMFAEQLEIFLAMLHQLEIVDDRLVLNGEDMGDISALESLQTRADTFSAEASLMFYGIDLADINLYREMDHFGFQEEGNVTTEILEEGRIAYLHISSFSNSGAFDSERLFPFYEEVQDFEHLIIDVRGNGGGINTYLGYIIGMLIDEPIEASYHEFLMGGDLVQREFMDDEMLSSEEGTVEVFLARDFIKEQDFPYFNRSALDVLEYVVTWPIVFEPREDNIPFAGEIWILVDGGSASLSELLAMIAIDSGFATVIGEPTAGITPALHTYISLPNTGIIYRMDIGYIIDVQGRSLEEYGVTPDVVIESGEDALEVVLDLINK